MQLKPRLKTQLEKVREISEGMLAAFETPEQWTHQIFPDANHALWFVGHMAMADNYFISMLTPEKAIDLNSQGGQFGMGSTPTANADDYPPVTELLDTMRERRATLLAILDGMSEDDLARSVPEGSPDMWTDLASVLEMAVWHETLHAGQVSLARRALGHQPLFGSQPEEEAAS